MAWLNQTMIQEWYSYFIGSEPFRYHCWHKSPEKWSEDGKINRTFGVLNLIAGLILLMTSSLVLWAFLSHSVMKSSYFKTLLFLGVVSWFEVLTVLIWPSFNLTTGSVFCSHPIIGMIMGRAFTMEWVAGSSFCVLLALNRVADMTQPKYLISYFKQPKLVTITLILMVFYSLSFATFTDPCVYNSTRREFSVDPQNGMQAYLFGNPFLALHNTFFVLMLAVFAAIMIYQLITKYYMHWRGTDDLQRKILVQCSLTCAQYLIPCIVYLFMLVWNRQEEPKCFIEGTHLWFQFGCGFWAIFCLRLNPPIRTRFLQNIGMAKFCLPHRVGNAIPSVTRTAQY